MGLVHAAISSQTQRQTTAADTDQHCEMASETVTVFVARCPLGEQCSKKGGILCKKLDELDVRDAVAWHLQASPYHELAEDEARNMADSMEIESWDEKTAVWEREQADSGERWYANRKKPRRGGDASSTRGPDPISVLARSSRFGGNLSLGRDSEVISMSTPQLKACIDSLRRAKDASQSAAALCSKAARAFQEEADVIENCKGVLESYLP